jgi:hypothetical protein
MEEMGAVLLGAVFVAISAAERFNTPVTNRCSTTRLRYYTAAFCYQLFGIGLYFSLLGFRPLLAYLQREIGFFGGLATGLSPAPFVALLLTILLPKIPLLADFDAWIRQHLQRMGAIPHEARRLAVELHKSGFFLSPKLREEVTARLASDGFLAEDLLFEESTGLKHLWTKTAALMIQLEGWETDRKFTGFIDQFSKEYLTLKERFQRVQPRVRNYFRLVRGLASGGDSRTDDLMVQVQGDLAGQCTEVLNELYSFISRGLLQCGLTYGARATSLALLGFDLHTIKIRPKITLNHLMTLFGVVGIVVLAIFMLVGNSSGVPFEELLARVVMICVIYTVAMICAVYPKDRMAIARGDSRVVRPVAFYFLAGILAALASLAISFLFNVFIFGSLSRTWSHLLLTYPWSLCSFAAAFMAAWMMDNSTPVFFGGIRLRWVEGLAGACTQALSVLIVLPWLNAVAAQHQALAAHRPPLPVALIMNCAIGFTIGYLIPTWYREAPRDSGLIEDLNLADRLQPLATE